jgi:hypothetical protein
LEAVPGFYFHYGSRLFFPSRLIDPSSPFTAQSKSVLIILERKTLCKSAKASISNSCKSRNKRNNPATLCDGLFVKKGNLGNPPKKALKKGREITVILI